MLLFDPLFLALMLPGLALSLWASARVRRTFQRHRGSVTGTTGAEVARRLLERHGVSGVTVEATRGQLTDHYDPRSRVLRLSSGVHDDDSVAAVGVAAHEAGHAIQHAEGYRPLKFRSLVVQPARFGSNLGVLLAVVGLLINAAALVWIGTALFGFFVLFTLATLPVEYDASRRAIRSLEGLGVLRGSQLEGATEVLRAAGMTYLAAAATAVLQLVYFLMLSED